MPTRANCGDCHFYGGGGDNFKHGDQSLALFNPDPAADVPNATFWATVATNIHLLAAYAVSAFVVAHVYSLSMAHTFREHVKPMITGFEKIDLSPEDAAYLEADEPSWIRQGQNHAPRSTSGLAVT